MRRPWRVLIYQQILPHYRKWLFEALFQELDLEFYLICDSKSDSQGIKNATISKNSRIIESDAKRKCFFGVELFWLKDVIGQLRRLKPDVVVALGNPYSITSWALLFYGRLWNIPVLLWTHGLLTPESGAKGFMRRTFYRLAKALLLYGDHAKALLVESGLEPQRMFVVYNSLDSETQQKHLNKISQSDVEVFRAGLGLEIGGRIVVFSGRLQKNKKLSLLLEAVGILRERGRILHAVFIGDGKERSVLTDLAENLGVASQIHFLGETYDERYIATVFMASDLSVVPSGAGLSVIHSLGYGVPVLLHDRPGEHFPEWEAVQEGETGFFYQYGNVKDMADKMDTALFLTSQRQKMKEACLATIRNRYNTVAHAEAIISSVEQVVERKL